MKVEMRAWEEDLGRAVGQPRPADGLSIKCRTGEVRGQALPALQSRWWRPLDSKLGALASRTPSRLFSHACPLSCSHWGSASLIASCLENGSHFQLPCVRRSFACVLDIVMYSVALTIALPMQALGHPRSGRCLKWLLPRESLSLDRTLRGRGRAGHLPFASHCHPPWGGGGGRR